MSEWVARRVAIGRSMPRHALLAGLGLLRCNLGTARRSPARSGAVAFSTYPPVIAIVLWPSISPVTLLSRILTEMFFLRVI